MSGPGHSTGYGPRGRRPLFDGDERKFEIWELKFTSYLRICGLHEVIDPPPQQPDGQDTPLDLDTNKNAEVFAELVQCLDDRSISLIIRDAKNDGKKALEILKLHYQPKGKARVITLYTQLTSLIKGSESVTDYVIRAETIAAALRDAEETISDSLLIAMVLKGLPCEFKPFVVVMNEKGKITFNEFKVALRNFEDNDNLNKTTSTDESVMAVGASATHHEHSRFKRNMKRWCNKCRSDTHDTTFCKRKRFHKTDTHWTSQCRNRPTGTSGPNPRHQANVAAADMENDEHSFSFVFTLGDSNSAPAKCDNDHDRCTLLIDSGATVHIINDKDRFVNLNKDFRAENHIIELADGTRAEGLAKGQGNAIITLRDTLGNTRDVELKNVLYIPTFSQNILSVPAATRDGATVSFSGDSGTIKFKELEDVAFRVSKSKNLYFINTVKARTLNEWHRVLGHCNTNDILSLDKNGIEIKDPKSKIHCETCTLGKMTQSRNHDPETKTDKQFDRVYIDLAGPVDPIAKDGFRYALVCVDDFSHLYSVYMLKNKSDAGNAFKRYLADIAPFGSVKCVRSDQGGEFVSKEFSQLLIENKIKHEKTAPYSPHQNGKAERAWRTIFEMARCLLLESGLPKHLWSYAVMASAYIRNRCYNKDLGKTPYEAITSKQPNLDHMHVFGQTCFALIQKPKKLDDRSQKGIFVGYDRDSPAFLVYFPETNVVQKVRVVKFLDEEKEDFVFHREKQGAPQSQNVNYDNPQTNSHVLIDDEEEEDFVFHREKQDAPQNVNYDNPQTNSHALIDDEEEEDFVFHREKQGAPQNVNYDIPQSDADTSERERTRRKPKYLNDYLVDDEADEHLSVTVHHCYNVSENVPQSYSEAISSSDAKKWDTAMKEEMRALVENDTFDLVPLPKDREVVKGKWVYTVKTDAIENKLYKARFVAKGYSQVEGIDYNETFSPTARMNSIRLITQLSVEKELNLHQMDVKAAYLNAPIDCPIYVEQPEGFETKSENGEVLVLKLNKSLYGLKQSGRNWNNTIDAYLIENGFQKSINDPCFYYKQEENIFLLVWVDDLLISADSCAVESVKETLTNKFKMKDLGQVSLFLGIEFGTEIGQVTMSQEKYIAKILDRFGMQDCKPRATPCELNPQVTESDPLNESELKLYRQIVGALIYVMTATRPDISYTITKLSQYMSCALKHHMTMAKHVLRYLKGTINEKLVFVKSDEGVNVTGFCDADWANDDDRKSITGYCFRITNQGPMISWKSRKQPTVALSSCEAEYMSMTAAVQEGKYLMSLLIEVLNFNQNQFALLCDNQGAIALAKNPVKHNRSKHIDIRYHFIRDEVATEKVVIQYVPTEDNVADVFTKPMSKIKFQKFKSAIFG